jgi:hypothetical protein
MFPEGAMTSQVSVHKFVDRRWYPTDDPATWAQATRESMFASIRRCVAHAIGVPLRAGMVPHELVASDEVFQQLYSCASSCARSLQTMGLPDTRTVAMVVAAAIAAAEPDELPPAVLAAIEEWCREACH